MDSVRKFSKGLVHGIAHCVHCGWTCEDYLVVQRRAAVHARQHQHRVSVELGYMVVYDYTEGAS